MAEERIDAEMKGTCQREGGGAGGHGASGGRHTRGHARETPRTRKTSLWRSVKRRRHEAALRCGLYRMLTRYAERLRFKHQVLSTSNLPGG